MLSGLAAVAIPIVIHLLNRSRARVVDWGAMRFLEASLASRSRRILIEEIMLLVLRCLIIALAVFAVARPFLPTRPTLLVILFVPAVVAGAICAALAAAMWADRRLRRIFLVATVALLVLPVAAGGVEQAFQGSRWSFASGEKDVAVVVDGSMSMTLAREGKTNFSRAIDEARAVAASCGPADGVSLILAGPAPRAVIGSPTSNQKDIDTALKALQPMGGSMRVVQAFQMACRSLTDGANPAKKIILITDGQNIGWDVRTQARWKFLASALGRHPTPPHIIVRTLDLPTRFTNAAVTAVTLDRQVVGTDREVQVQVKVEGTGTEPMRSRTVKVFIDGQEAGSEEISDILPNAAQTVSFKHRFDSPGRHIISAKLDGKDDLAGDDAADRVVDVLSALPVLIIDGTPSMRPLEGAGDFIDIALAPPLADDEPRDGSRPKRAERDRHSGCLVATEVVRAPDIAKVEDLGKYAAVILADVPLLPKAFADKLTGFIRDGGGLLIAPGSEAQPKFYNVWTDRAGQPVLPGKLARLRSAAEKPSRLSLNTFSHPALAKVADEDQSDARLATITSYWLIEPPENDRDVAVCGSLDTAEPFVVERKLGKGYVLLAAGAFHPRSTNLPALKCFVPMMHELTYYLASPAMAKCNVESGTDVALEFRAEQGGGARGGTGLKAEYFNDLNFQSPALMRVDRRIDFDWGEAAPHPRVGADDFAVRWTGKLDPPRSGTYTFHTLSDDGIRLWVEGKSIINNWTGHGRQERQGQAKLTAGRKVDIRLEYYDSSAAAVAKLSWSGPVGERQIIPTRRLYNDAIIPAAKLIAGDKVDVVAPSGARLTATVARAAGPLRIDFDQTHQPGLYRLILPQGLADQYAAMSPDARGVPFVVLDSGDESSLAAITDADLQTAREHLLASLKDADPAKTLVRVEATNELTAAVAGGIPGRELWQFMAVILVGALLAEIALTRWIARQRRTHTIRPVAFGSDAVDIQSFRGRAEELLAVDAASGRRGEEVRPTR